MKKSLVATILAAVLLCTMLLTTACGNGGYYSASEIEQYLNVSSLGNYKGLDVEIDEVKMPGEKEVDEYIADLLAKSVTRDTAVKNEAIKDTDVVGLYWIAYRPVIEERNMLDKNGNEVKEKDENGNVVKDEKGNEKPVKIDVTVWKTISEFTNISKSIFDFGTVALKGSNKDVALYTVGSSDDDFSDNYKAVKAALKEALVDKKPQGHAFELKTKDYTAKNTAEKACDDYLFISYKRTDKEGVAGSTQEVMVDLSRLDADPYNLNNGNSELERAIQKVLLGEDEKVKGMELKVGTTLENVPGDNDGTKTDEKTGKTTVLSATFEITVKAALKRPENAITVEVDMTFPGANEGDEDVTEKVTVCVYLDETQHCTVYEKADANFILNKPVYFVTDVTGEDEVVAAYRASILEDLTKKAEDEKTKAIYNAIWKKICKGAKVKEWPAGDIDAYVEEKWNNLGAEYTATVSQIRYYYGMYGNSIYSGSTTIVQMYTGYKNLDSFYAIYPSAEHYIVKKLEVKIDATAGLTQANLDAAKEVLRTEAKQSITEKLILNYIAETEGWTVTDAVYAELLKKYVDEANALNLKNAKTAVKKNNAEAEENYKKDLATYKEAAEKKDATQAEKDRYASFLEMYPTWESYKTTLEDQYKEATVEDLKAQFETAGLTEEQAKAAFLWDYVLEKLAEGATVTEKAEQTEESTGESTEESTAGENE